MVYAGSRSDFLTLRASVNSVCIPVISTHSEIILAIPSGQGQSVLMREPYAANFLQPIHITAKIFCCARFYLVLPELVRREHLKFINHHIRGSDGVIGRVKVSILRPFLRVYQHYSIASTCSINRGSRTVLKDVD